MRFAMRVTLQRTWIPESTSGSSIFKSSRQKRRRLAFAPGSESLAIWKRQAAAAQRLVKTTEEEEGGTAGL